MPQFNVTRFSVTPLAYGTLPVEVVSCSLFSSFKEACNLFGVLNVDMYIAIAYE